MSSSEFFVKLRDCAQMIAGAAQQYLETMIPKEPSREGRIPDLSQIIWKEATGNKGPFQVAEKTANANAPAFKELKDYLRIYNGKAKLQGFFVWVFTDGSERK